MGREPPDRDTPRDLFRVGDAQSGKRIDRLLKAERPDLPYARLQRLFREKGVLVDDRPVAPNYRVQAGERIAVAAPRDLRRTPPTEGLALPVVHEDDAILVLDKPPGVPMQPGAKHPTRSVVNGLLHTHPDLRALGDRRDFGLVHRLDRGTSGLVVVAKTVDAHRRLLETFRTRGVDKRYVALVAGRPAMPTYAIDRRLERAVDRGQTTVRVAPRGAGQAASTRVRVTDAGEDWSLVEAQPVTGRTHQIRVHLASTGHPVVGDERYGNARTNQRALDELGLDRMFLHAAALAFPHPDTAASVRFASALPRDLARVLDRADLALD